MCVVHTLVQSSERKTFKWFETEIGKRNSVNTQRVNDKKTKKKHHTFR